MKKNLKFIILGVLMVSLILGYYYYVSHKKNVDNVDEITTEVSEVQKLINKNIINDYPPTPREVMRIYSDITVAFYTCSYTEEELEALGNKIRELYDMELLIGNPVDEYMNALKEEISQFKNQGVSFSSYAISAPTDVVYFDKDGYSYARLNVAFTVKQGTSAGVTKEVFVLRKDDSGHWKIFGWTLAKED